MAKEYGSKDIQVLEGLEAVRMRPGMYIGTTGTRGLHHLLWEIVDNAMDEAMAGYATQISVSLMKDGSAVVEDNGRGMPVDPHPTLGISGVEVIFTRLHAGGKFNNNAYAYSGGAAWRGRVRGERAVQVAGLRQLCQLYALAAAVPFGLRRGGKKGRLRRLRTAR